MDKKTFLSPIEAAKVAQCSRRTIYRQIEAGTVKAIKFGKSWRIDRQAFYKKLGIEPIESSPVQINFSVGKR